MRGILNTGGSQGQPGRKENSLMAHAWRRGRSRGLALGLAVAALGGIAAVPAARAAGDAGFLSGIHRFGTLTSTVPSNGDQTPYAIVVAPVSAGKIHKDD